MSDHKEIELSPALTFVCSSAYERWFGKTVILQRSISRPTRTVPSQTVEEEWMLIARIRSVQVKRRAANNDGGARFTTVLEMDTDQHFGNSGRIQSLLIDEIGSPTEVTIQFEPEGAFSSPGLKGYLSEV